MITIIVIIIIGALGLLLLIIIIIIIFKKITNKTRQRLEFLHISLEKGKILLLSGK